MFTKTSAILALAASASAHVVLQDPMPFLWEDSATQQSPLEPADFPCKQPSGAYVPQDITQWNAGETHQVKLKGGATHGGGSCQFSITTDQKPTKDTQWKVIKSVIGQCPGGPPDDNTSGNKDDTSNPGFDVTLPKDLPAGNYTFSWTWLNKLGNREFYQNCAPIAVGGSSGASAQADASSALGSLPDMFVINLPATECTNTEKQDFQYPDPGNDVVTGSAAVPGTQTNGAGCAAMTVLGAGNGQMGAPAKATGAPAASGGASQPAASQPAATSAAAAPSNPGGVFAPGASSAPAPTQPAASQPAASQPAATQPAAQPSGTGVASPPSGTGAPSSGAGCTPCDSDGAVVCIGTNQFGLCNRGCAVAQDLAAGMACANGSITRRSVRFPRAHLHRRHGSQMI